MAKLESMHFRCRYAQNTARDKQGIRVIDCKREFTYLEAIEHFKIHMSPYQYMCNRCDNPLKYRNVQELSELHWMKDCHGFSNVYELCRRCDVQKVLNMKHDCVQNMLEDI